MPGQPPDSPDSASRLMPQHAWPLARVVAAAALLAAVVFAAFLPVLGHEFLEWDDHLVISQNPDFLPPRVSTLGHYWTASHMQFYVPVTYTIWWTLAHFAVHPGPAGGLVLWPMPYHAANLLAHIGAAMFAYRLLARLTRSEAAAWFAAALFALHPLQAEPVSWASTMYSSLSSCLALGAMCAYFAFSDADAASPLGGRRRSASRWTWYVLFIAGYGLALLTKPTIILLPIIVGLIDVAARRRPLGRTVALLAPVLLVGAIPIAVATQTANPFAAADVPLVLRPLVASDVLAFYMRSIVVPLHLAPDYGRSPRWLMNEGSRAMFTTWLIPFAVFAASAIAWRRTRWPSVACGVFVLALVPVLGLTPFDFQRYSTVADRYVCFALIAPAMLVAAGLARTSSPRPLLATCGVVAVAFGVMSNLQTRHWRDTDTFYDFAMARNPDSFAAHTRAINVLAKQGRWDEVLVHYQAALDAYPDSQRLWHEMGRIYVRRRDWPHATECFTRAAGLEPDNVGTLCSLAVSLSREGRGGEAVAVIERALRLSPQDPATHLDAAAVYGTAGRFDDARREFNEVIRLGGDANAARSGLETLDRLSGR